MKTSIIIPVKNSLPALLNNLESISRQDISLIQEVIIVENGSDQVHVIPSHLNLRIIKLPDGNRSLARNVGSKDASSPILIFLDADVVLGNDWLSTVLRGFDPETLAVQTAIVPASNRVDHLQKFRKQRSFYRNQHTFFSINADEIGKIVLNSAALAIKASVFHELGGFDEKLTRHEDLDLTQRLLRHKGKIKAIGATACEVYFHHGLMHYFLREFDCGFHVVRYHEKWSSVLVSDSIIHLSKNFFKWLLSIKTTNFLNAVSTTEFFLRFVYLVGNCFGIFKKVLNPYSDRFSPSQEVKSQQVFE